MSCIKLRIYTHRERFKWCSFILNITTFSQNCVLAKWVWWWCGLISSLQKTLADNQSRMSNFQSLYSSPGCFIACHLPVISTLSFQSVHSGECLYRIMYYTLHLYGEQCCIQSVTNIAFKCEMCTLSRINHGALSLLSLEHCGGFLRSLCLHERESRCNAIGWSTERSYYNKLR